ncbi:FAD binding domain-containing protein [Tepidibacter hydrothermalis]|uniref:Xanthine dehydrogenase family protein subunit M n=1 Tax=Tepidibacter hydrothermalis TaxID=3036126 RepID=A0ABY8EEX5_9FIRM|nr:xanthine dehydrogenase family protein subunit M [Tepidibacter hydrothermalis]WFD09375.1 xanthine dehydrogenase family protein subunit M [Tepidibacter hydrothermalis]
MKMYSPTEISEVLEFLQEHKESGILLAGGTDLIVKYKEQSLPYDFICNILKVEKLKYIKEDEDSLKIGPLVTHEELMESSLVQKHIPVLRDACKTIGSPQIRNRGTIGGNIGTASPAGDTLPALTALGASLKTISIEEERIVPIKDFFRGPGKTILKENEMIKEIIVPKMKEEKGFYTKLGSRNALAISITGVAAKVKCKGQGFEKVEVAFGSVGPTVIYKRVKELEKSNFTKQKLWDAVQCIKEQIYPITDVRATAEYRKEMCANLLYEGLNKILDYNSII